MRPSQPRTRSRLELEPLETRSLLSTFSGTFSGVAFVDANANGVFDAGEAKLAGVTVKLGGFTPSGTPVSASTTTDATGAYSFQNVLPGTYELSASSALGFLSGSTGSANVVSGITLNDAQTITQNFGFRGLQPAFISMRSFLTNSSGPSFPAAPAGNGQDAVNSRADNTPTISNAIADVSVSPNSSSTVIDLAANFTDPDITNSTIRFDTNAGPINVTLFDTTAPQTVTNFFNYITSNRFDSSIFHRLATGFVLQGGGFTFTPSPAGITSIATDPAVQNEFGASNTIGTISMAKLGSDPNSATSQFFFNLGNNSSNLDNQNGGFTVFGKINGPADQTVINTLTSATVTNESSFNSALDTIPLNNYTGSNFPTDTTAANYDLINDVSIVSRNEVLTYSVVANSNPGLVTATIQNNRLTLQYTPNQIGTATIAVQATDEFGATVKTFFNVKVG